MSTSKNDLKVQYLYDTMSKIGLLKFNFFVKNEPREKLQKENKKKCKKGTQQKMERSNKRRTLSLS